MDKLLVKVADRTVWGADWVFRNTKPTLQSKLHELQQDAPAYAAGARAMGKCFTKISFSRSTYSQYGPFFIAFTLYSGLLYAAAIVLFLSLLLPLTFFILIVRPNTFISLAIGVPRLAYYLASAQFPDVETQGLVNELSKIDNGAYLRSLPKYTSSNVSHGPITYRGRRSIWRQILKGQFSKDSLKELLISFIPIFGTIYGTSMSIIRFAEEIALDSLGPWLYMKDLSELEKRTFYHQNRPFLMGFYIPLALCSAIPFVGVFFQVMAGNITAHLIGEIEKLDSINTPIVESSAGEKTSEFPRLDRDKGDAEKKGSQKKSAVSDNRKEL